MDHELQIPEGWSKADYAEPGADTGKTKKNLELVKPGPQSGEDDYHSKYTDPEGQYGAAKVEDGEKPSYGGAGGAEQEGPEGTLPMVPQDWGLQAPRYPARHKGVASSY